MSKFSIALLAPAIYVTALSAGSFALGERYAAYYHAVSIAVAAVFAAVIFAAGRRGGRGAAALRLSPPSGLNALLAAAGGLCFTVSATSLLNVLPLSADTLKLYAEASERTFAGPPVLVFVSLCLISPFIEELLFRGVTQRLFTEGGMSEYWAIAAQAALYAMFRIDAIQSVYAFAAAVCFGLVYARTRSLLASVIFHVAANTGETLYELAVNALFPEGGADTFLKIAFAAGAALTFAALHTLYRRTAPKIDVKI